MLAIISGFLLLVLSAVAKPLRPALPSLLNASSHISTGASTWPVPNAFQCFNASFPPPGPFYPIKYSGCIDTANKMLANLRRDVPLIFSRSENADIHLPWRTRTANCMIDLDVLDEDEEDIMSIREAHEIASALCRVCVSGFYRYGGRTPVGPRGVVYVSVYGTTPVAVEAASTSAAAPQPSHKIAGRIEPRGPGLISTSPPVPASISVINTSNTDECFSPFGPSPRRHLYPVNSFDCLNAASEILKGRRAHVSMSFGRGAGMDFKLPWTARNRSCVVTLDTLNNFDSDTIVLREVYSTALDRIEECTIGENIFGGRKVVGSKKVVYVFVFGIGSPLQMSTPALSTPTHVVARAQIENSELSLLNTSWSQTTEMLNLTSVSTTDVSTLRGIPECFDPPMPRERAVPISNFTDCEAATVEIVGSRIRTQVYVFSRKPSEDPNHYQLPSTFRTRTCVVHLDMEHENNEDAVRLAYVESTAWVLASKCSGLEKAEEKWGGTMTVSVGARDLIRVTVYGVLPPTLDESSPSQVASLLESE